VLNTTEQMAASSVARTLHGRILCVPINTALIIVSIGTSLINNA